MPKVLLGLCLLLLLGGCDSALAPTDLADSAPEFRPDVFFEGRTRSWGVWEDGFGDPTGTFGTETTGHREPDGTLVLDQVLHVGGEPMKRQFRLKRVDAHRYEATSDSVVGIAVGEAYGRSFHWRYTLALEPGTSWKTVEFEHWMYLQDGGDAMVNRFAVRKLGVTLRHATELFHRLPAGG